MTKDLRLEAGVPSPPGGWTNKTENIIFPFPSDVGGKNNKIQLRSNVLGTDEFRQKVFHFDQLLWDDNVHLTNSHRLRLK